MGLLLGSLEGDGGIDRWWLEKKKEEDFLPSVVVASSLPPHSKEGGVDNNSQRRGEKGEGEQGLSLLVGEVEGVGYVYINVPACRAVEDEKANLVSGRSCRSV